MIVCHCAGVTDRAVIRLIHEGASTVAEIGRRSGAGQCCASCHEVLAALLSRGSAGAPRPPAADPAGAGGRAARA